MTYSHTGEIGDVWKHLPLCSILEAEKPIRYHETNSAFSGYLITKNPRTEYGVFSLLKEIALNEYAYIRALKRNGIDSSHYTGSPGLAMDILSDKSMFFFHDTESDALNDILSDADKRELLPDVSCFCSDSLQTFTDSRYVLDSGDFVFIDPYTPFDKNDSGFTYFDVFSKSVLSGSKTLFWYGFDSLEGRKKITDQFKETADKLNIRIQSFDIRQECMTDSDCSINPGVPGCGLACANLTDESVNILSKCLKIIGRHYEDSKYNGEKAPLLTGSFSF